MNSSLCPTACVVLTLSDGPRIFFASTGADHGSIRQKAQTALPALVFKSGEAFIDYHCKYMVTTLERDAPLAALVINARERSGTSEAVKIDERGIQTATLRVASDDGGFITIAQTLSNRGDALKPGDVVAWVPGVFNAKLARATDDERFGWVGLIVAKVAPEIDISKNEMTIISRY